MASQDTNSIVDDFLGDNPRAAQWRALREALAERLGGLRRARQVEAQTEPGSEKLKSLEAQIGAVERQIAALQTEEVVAEFVENSLHVTLARSALDAQGDEQE